MQQPSVFGGGGGGDGDGGGVPHTMSVASIERSSYERRKQRESTEHMFVDAHRQEELRAVTVKACLDFALRVI